jgi:thioredoxin 1
MPFICIGPVCIPWTAVAPILIWLARPVWSRLPQSWRDGFTSRYVKLQDSMQVAVWDKIGWKAKPKKKEKQAAGEMAAATDGGAAKSKSATLLSGRGSVVGLHSDADWEAAKALTKEHPEVALIVDFTATWCGPCQRIAPDFARLAKEHPTALFVKVDVDELEDVAQEAGVMAMPTFHAYRGGAQKASMSGANVDKLAAMVKDAIA